MTDTTHHAVGPEMTGKTRDRTVLSEAAVVRVTGVAVILALLWLAVTWAVAVP